MGPPGVDHVLRLEGDPAAGVVPAAVFVGHQARPLDVAAAEGARLGGTDADAEGEGGRLVEGGVSVRAAVAAFEAGAIAIAVESAIIPQTNLVLRIPGIGKYSSMETAVVIIMVSSRSYGTAAIIDYCFQPAGTNLAPGHVAVEGWC